ncbi:hypothetical protein D3C77_432170 [compost metagenome]
MTGLVPVNVAIFPISRLMPNARFRSRSSGVPFTGISFSLFPSTHSCTNSVSGNSVSVQVTASIILRSSLPSYPLKGFVNSTMARCSSAFTVTALTSVPAGKTPVNPLGNSER